LWFGSSFELTTIQTRQQPIRATPGIDCSRFGSIEQEGGVMSFTKLFKILVLGGAMVGTAGGCAAGAQNQKPTAQSGGSDPAPPDSSAPAKPAEQPSSGGGVQGW
jgi:hypothetical protein